MIAEPPERVPKILCAARMCIWKGHRYLLEALAILKERGLAFTCELAGDGELRRDVTQAIERMALTDRVAMVGRLPHADLVRRLGAGEWDVFALASTERPGEHEGIPVAVMEAMAAGVPVVSTQTGSLDELIDAGSGFLVPQRDPEALADALAHLLTDVGLRRRTGLRGRDRVRAEFETTRTTAQLYALIERATPKRGSSQPTSISALGRRSVIRPRPNGPMLRAFRNFGSAPQPSILTLKKDTLDDDQISTLDGPPACRPLS